MPPKPNHIMNHIHHRSCYSTHASTDLADTSALAATELDSTFPYDHATLRTPPSSPRPCPRRPQAVAAPPSTPTPDYLRT